MTEGGYFSICEETDYPKVIRAGLTEADKRAHARKLNMARRHLTQEQRRGLIREQLSETPELSDRQIAAGLGVDNSTVSRHRKQMEETSQLLQYNSSIGTDGKERPRQVNRKPISVRKELERTAEIPQFNTNIGADGKERPHFVEFLSDAVLSRRAGEWIPALLLCVTKYARSWENERISGF